MDQCRKPECVEVVYYALLEIKEKRKLLGESLLSAKNRLCGGIFNFFLLIHRFPSLQYYSYFVLTIKPNNWVVDCLPKAEKRVLIMLDTTHEMNAIIDQKHSIVINLLNADYGRGQSTKREK